MELCIFDGSKIFQKYAFFHGKMHIFLFFGWLQKMHNSIFLEKILEPSKMHNSMKTLVFGQNQRNMTYAFSAASRKAKKYAFSHGKMHISEKSWNHQKCIIP